jgi:ribosomal protein L7Ae-like RNA K-turn-binding protein
LIAPLPSLIHCSPVPILVVESNDALGRAAHVPHDEANAGIKFSGMLLDLGDTLRGLIQVPA